MKNLSGAENNGQVSSLKTHKTYSSYKEFKKSERIINLGGVFSLIFTLLLIVIVFRIVVGSSSGDITFAGLLDYISTIQPPIVDMSIFHVSIGEDWGIFNFLRVFINSILSLFDFFCSFNAFIINGLSFIFDILRWLLV